MKAAILALALTFMTSATALADWHAIVTVNHLLCLGHQVSPQEGDLAISTNDITISLDREIQENGEAKTTLSYAINRSAPQYLPTDELRTKIISFFNVSLSLLTPDLDLFSSDRTFFDLSQDGDLSKPRTFNANVRIGSDNSEKKEYDVHCEIALVNDCDSDIKLCNVTNQQDAFMK